MALRSFYMEDISLETLIKLAKEGIYLKIPFLDNFHKNIKLPNRYTNDHATSVSFTKNMFAFTIKYNIYIFDSDTKALINKIDTLDEEITDIAFDPSSKYLIGISSKGKVISYRYDIPYPLYTIYEFPNNNIENKIKTKQIVYNSMTFHNNCLAFVWGGNICILDILLDKVLYMKEAKGITSFCFFNDGEFVSCKEGGYIETISIKNNNLKTSTKVDISNIKGVTTSSDPALLVINSTKNISIFDTTTNKLIKQNYITTGVNIDKVIPYRDSFLILSKNTIKKVQKTSNDTINQTTTKLHYKKFKEYIKEDKTTLAYAMVQKHPLLKHTIQYTNLQKEWQECFEKAQKDMLEGEYDKAKQRLKKYTNVLSKKTIINFMLRQSEQYTTLLKTLKKDNIYKTTTKLAKIQSTKQLKTEITKTIQHLKMEKKLEIAYSVSDFASCYELIDRYRYLQTTQLGTMLQKHYSKTIQTCEEYAIKGDMSMLKQASKNIVNIKSKEAKLLNLLKLCSSSMVFNLLSKREFDSVQQAIYKYIDIFGKDTNIKFMIKIYETKTKTKIAVF